MCSWRQVCRFQHSFWYNVSCRLRSTSLITYQHSLFWDGQGNFKFTILISWQDNDQRSYKIPEWKSIFHHLRFSYKTLVKDSLSSKPLHKLITHRTMSLSPYYSHWPLVCKLQEWQFWLATKFPTWHHFEETKKVQTSSKFIAICPLGYGYIIVQKWVKNLTELSDNTIKRKKSSDILVRMYNSGNSHNACTW